MATRETGDGRVAILNTPISAPSEIGIVHQSEETGLAGKIDHELSSVSNLPVNTPSYPHQFRLSPFRTLDQSVQGLVQGLPAFRVTFWVKDFVD
jgi:hypothetical protein